MHHVGIHERRGVRTTRRRHGRQCDATTPGKSADDLANCRHTVRTAPERTRSKQPASDAERTNNHQPPSSHIARNAPQCARSKPHRTLTPRRARLTGTRQTQRATYRSATPRFLTPRRSIAHDETRRRTRERSAPDETRIKKRGKACDEKISAACGGEARATQCAYCAAANATAPTALTVKSSAPARSGREKIARRQNTARAPTGVRVVTYKFVAAGTPDWFWGVIQVRMCAGKQFHI